MARCYNCGCDISEEDRTKLCDECKKILLPFVKFMDASTSSAVRRLISNETNLRNAGVTDSGMEYLLRICELHDKSKAEENNEDEEDDDLVVVSSPAGSDQTQEFDRSGLDTVSGGADNTVTADQSPKQNIVKNDKYSDVEVPLDKPLRLIRREYGQYIEAAEIVLGVISAALLVWFLVKLIAWNGVDFAAVAGCISSAVGVYVAETVRKMLHDVDELKKHFR